VQSKKKRSRTFLGARTGGETDAAFEALSHPLRRQLLVSVADEGTVTLTSSATDFSNDELVSIYHSHLPKLLQMELVEWDGFGHELSRGRQFETVEPLLDLLVDASD
jgi:hypothetical protein